jgi:hypothetical protein
VYVLNAWLNVWEECLLVLTAIPVVNTCCKHPNLPFPLVPALKAIVDSLVFAKINVVHWHMVDTQSFPFMRYASRCFQKTLSSLVLEPLTCCTRSPTYPKLGSAGAWSPQERFTPADVAELVSLLGHGLVC